jgi:hypothetical protein
MIVDPEKYNEAVMRANDRVVRDIRKYFGVKIGPTQYMSYTALNLANNLNLLHPTKRLAIFETDNPKIYIEENISGSLLEKFRPIIKLKDDRCLRATMDSILPPDKKEMTLTAKLKVVSEARYFGPTEEMYGNDGREVSFLDGKFTHAWEVKSHFVDGIETHTLDIFDQNGGGEAREIDRRETGGKIDPVTYKFVIKRAQDGVKVSVDYDIKDQS